MRAASLLLLGLAGGPMVSGASSAVTRQDDAYHFAFWEDGRHDANYTEWWYFNLVEPEHDLQVAFAYWVIDPANRSRRGLAAVVAMVYTPGGSFQEAAYLPPDSFSASYDQADVAIGDPPSGRGRIEVIDDARYRIVGTVAGDHRVSWNLVYESRKEPWFALDRQRVGLFPWERMSWLVYMPGASVRGQVVIDGRTYRLRNARGYHDHNWGEGIPGLVTWNWAQYWEPGLSLGIGDFRSAPTGVVGLDFRGRRTVFEKSQYRLVHTAWEFDAVNGRRFPTTSWVHAENETLALVVRLEALATEAIVPPLGIPLLPEPLVYEQTAHVTGALWERDEEGEWRLRASFEGTGFKEYTSVTSASPP